MTRPRAQPGRRHDPSAGVGRTRAGDAGSTVRAAVREPQWSAVASWVVAVAAIVRATRAWDLGGLIVGLYFAVLSLVFWARAAISESQRGGARELAPHSVVFAVTFAIGGVLVVLDIASSGSL